MAETRLADQLLEDVKRLTASNAVFEKQVKDLTLEKSHAAEQHDKLSAQSLALGTAKGTLEGQVKELQSRVELLTKQAGDVTAEKNEVTATSRSVLVSHGSNVACLFGVQLRTQFDKQKDAMKDLEVFKAVSTVQVNAVQPHLMAHGVTCFLVLRSWRRRRPSTRRCRSRSRTGKRRRACPPTMYGVLLPVTLALTLMSF